MRKIITITMATLLAVFSISACGKKQESVKVQVVDDEIVTNVQETSEQVNEADVATLEAVEEATLDGLETISALADVEVDKNLFDVTLNVPKDFVGDVTQEELDKSVAEKGYKSATLNDDGSVTYVMTKQQHKELVDSVAQTIDTAMDEMVGSTDYPNITAVTANSNYTKFTITTTNTELSLSESISTLAFYMYGGMYGVFSGDRADNIEVEFKNDATGEVISTANSKNLGE